jgi:hypothetical protein
LWVEHDSKVIWVGVDHLRDSSMSSGAIRSRDIVGNLSARYQRQAVYFAS